MTRIRRSLNAVALVGFAISIWSCSGSTTPVGPSAPNLAFAPFGTPAAAPVAGELSGVVSEKNSGGQTPIEGATVKATLTNVPSAAGQPRIVTTDAEGRYRISDLPVGMTALILQVTSLAYTTLNSSVRVEGETRLDLQLVPRPRYTVSGVISEVSSAGLMPVEGATVEAFACDSLPDNCAHYIDISTTTGRDGSYQIPGLWAGRETGLWVFKDGYQVDGPTPLNCDGCSRLFTVSVDTQVDLQLVRR